jgi:hypothetical protein
MSPGATVALILIGIAFLIWIVAAVGIGALGRFVDRRWPPK